MIYWLPFIAYTISFYAVWFICIYSAANNQPWPGFFASVIVCLGAWFWQQYINKSQGLFRVVFTLAATGYVIDSILLFSGFIHFNANPWPLAPPWMLGLWLNFGVVYYACFQGLFKRTILLALLALIGFPLAYIAGVTLGAGQLYYGDWSVMLWGFLWMLLLPGLSYGFCNAVIPYESRS